MVEHWGKVERLVKGMGDVGRHGRCNPLREVKEEMERMMAGVIKGLILADVNRGMRR